MFGSKKTVVDEPQVTERGRDLNSRNLIGKGTVIEGEIISEGAIRIEGRLIGQISSKSKVIVGETGYIEGDVNCELMEVQGKVKGKIIVKDLLHLKSNSTIDGEVTTGKLVVDQGAKWNGTVSMGNNTLNAAKVPSKAEKEKIKQAV